MAGIDDILAGTGGNTRADFSNLFSGGIDAYNSGRDQKAKNDLRDAFKGGVPLTADGQPDFSAMAKILYQKGGLSEGTAAAQLGITQQNQQFGQQQSSNIGSVERGAPPPQSAIVSPPSSNRSASTVVAPPLNRGGQEQQGQAGGTLMQVLSAQGIPNNQLGAASASIGRQLGVDPSAPINLQDPQVRNVLVPAIQQLKRMGIGQVQQGQPQPQAQMAQGQPAPVTDAATTTAAPQTPSRNDQLIAYYSGIMSDPRSPKQNVDLAKTRLEAIQRNNEFTGPQKEYAQAVTQGYKGTFQDFASEQEAGKAGATERAKADVKEQQSYIDAGKTASNRLSTLNTLSNIISSDKNVTLGFGADTALKAKMALEQLGINVGDLSGSQAIQKLNATLAAESTKTMGGSRPTQFEFKTFLGNNPGLLLDKSGNERMIGIFSQLAKREVDLGRLARKNQDNWQNWDNVVENYDKSHPMVDPVTKKPITTDSIVAPGPNRGASSSSGTAQAASPPVPGARLAPDKNWYVPDPSRPGKYLRVVQ